MINFPHKLDLYSRRSMKLKFPSKMNRQLLDRTLFNSFHNDVIFEEILDAYILITLMPPLGKSLSRTHWARPHLECP
jgi:hypothetical protein